MILLASSRVKASFGLNSSSLSYIVSQFAYIHVSAAANSCSGVISSISGVSTIVGSSMISIFVVQVSKDQLFVSHVLISSSYHVIYIVFVPVSIIICGKSVPVAVSPVFVLPVVSARAVVKIHIANNIITTIFFRFLLFIFIV
jgi:hypothetical protein